VLSGAEGPPGASDGPPVLDGDAAYLFFEAAAATHLPNALLVAPYFDAKSVGLALRAALQTCLASRLIYHLLTG